jgi:hypothetical protein
MSKGSFIALFSGGGLKSIGAMAAGYDPALAVEFDAEIANAYAGFFGDKHVRCEDVCDTPDAVYRSLEDIALLLASPVLRGPAGRTATGASPRSILRPPKRRPARSACPVPAPW